MFYPTLRQCRNIGMLRQWRDKFKLDKWVEELRSPDTWLLILAAINAVHIWRRSNTLSNRFISPLFAEFTNAADSTEINPRNPRQLFSADYL
jgi:hypothetical protein